MNNSQFRRLLIDTPRQQDGDQSKAPAADAPKAVLGARKHSSMLMTPRQVGRGAVQPGFARQLAERNAKANPRNKAKSSAPKGTKLAAGYTDRTKERPEDEDNELVQRVKILEESMKSGEIDRETFDRLVQEITGGHVESTHLVRGLDRKLLERVRKGEDVLREDDSNHGESLEDTPEVEDAFDALEGQDVTTIVREKAEKKGERVTSPPAVAGVKRNRNDILKELKRQREEAAAAAAAEHEKKYPSLGPGFRKINASGETSRIETDDMGREVLIITGADGKERRKVKKQREQEQLEVRYDIDAAAKPTNKQIPPQPKADESSDDDIFQGVGSNYNPLAGIEDDEDDENDEDEENDHERVKAFNASKGVDVQNTSTATHPPSTYAKEGVAHDPTSIENARTKRDYFHNPNRDAVPAKAPETSAGDAMVRAALAKVRNLDDSSTLLQNLSSARSDDASAKEARLRKRAAELAASDRDLEDMDLGFGSSRFDDAEEMEREGEKIKLSQWKGIGVEDNGDDDEDGKTSAKKRKRGPKKKHGDKNNAGDVLQVMNRQKEKKTLG